MNTMSQLFFKPKFIDVNFLNIDIICDGDLLNTFPRHKTLQQYHFRVV